jgi:hypothetical protein
MTDNDIKQVMDYYEVDEDEAIKIIKDNDKAIIEQVYFDLLDNQEPLGEEFEEVLDANRWELYEGVVWH